MSLTSIIIISYNTLPFTRICVESIRQYTKSDSYEIIVVDNGSNDGSAEWLSEQIDICSVFNKENNGFPVACNQGLELAKGTELLFLNSDTVVTLHWLENLHQALYSNSNVGAVSCMTNNCANFQQISVPYKTLEEMQRFAAAYNCSNPALWQRWMTLVGYCFLFRRAIYEKLGGLDERFTPGNYEDDDYSLRIRAAGYELLLCRDTFIHHFGSISFREGLSEKERLQKKEYYYTLAARNKKKLIQKWGLSESYKVLHASIKVLPDQIAAESRMFLVYGTPMDFYILRETYPQVKFSGCVSRATDQQLVSDFADVVVWSKDSIPLDIGAAIKKPLDIILFVDQDDAALFHKNQLRQFQYLLRANGKMFYWQGNEVFESSAVNREEIVNKRQDDHPMISVMIPTYNMPKLFAITMASAAAQDYPNMEIIVCDNSTNDDTAHIMKAYQQDERVRYYRNRDAKSKEENFVPFEQLARGEYLQWLMHDDVLLPGKLTRMASVLQYHPEITLVTSQRGIIDGEGKRLKKHPLEVKLPIKGREYGVFSGEELGRLMLMNFANVIGEPSAVLFRRQDLRHHYWKADCRGYKTISDVAMWLELLEKGDCAIFREPLSYYRRHSGQEGQQSDVLLLSRIEWFSLIEEYSGRDVFLHHEADFLPAYRAMVEESRTTFSSLQYRASTKMWQRYQCSIKRMEEKSATNVIREWIASYQAAERKLQIRNRAECILQAAEWQDSDSMGQLDFFADKVRVLILAALEALDGRNGELAARYLGFFRREILEKPSFLPGYLFYQGMAAYTNGSWEQAAELYHAYVQQFPDDENGWFYLGNSCVRQEKWLEALNCYNRALERKKNFAECIVNIVWVMRQLGEQDTIEELQKSGLGSGLFDQDFMAYRFDCTQAMSVDSQTVRDLPIFINARDRLNCLEQQVQWLQQAGFHRIYILDNDSTYPELLTYYRRLEQQTDVQVIYLRRNLGHTALWDSNLLERLHIDSPYIYTDSDVLAEDCNPVELVGRLLQVLQLYPFLDKAGCGLRCDDITYYDKDRVQQIEQQLYTVPIEPDVYFAPLDTTFALYRDARHYCRQASARIVGRYMVRHLPWYYDYENLPDDECYYLRRAGDSSTLAVCLRNREEARKDGLGNKRLF